MKSALSIFCLANINSPSPNGMVADKLHAYFDKGEAAGVSFIKVLLPGEKSWRAKTAYEFFPLPRQTKFWFLSGISFALKLLQLKKFRGRILEIKSRHLRRSWSDVIETTKPDLIMGIGLPQELLNESNIRGIQSIEIQHGIIDAPSILRYWPLAKPTKFFCWDENTVRLAKEEGLNAINVGHPISLPYRGRETPAEARGGSGSGHPEYFCVALSWGVPKSEDPFGTLHSGLVQLIDNLVSLGHSPLFRVHPVTASRTLTPFFLKRWIEARWPECAFHNPRHWSIRESTSVCSFLVAQQSSAAYEFGLLGKPSTLLDTYYAEAIHQALGLGGEAGMRLIHTGYDELAASEPQTETVSRFQFQGLEEILKSGRATGF